MTSSATYTAKNFEIKMDGFIDYCESEGLEATDYQLIKYFGITAETLELYRDANKMKDGSIYKQPGFTAALKKLDLYREDATIRQIKLEPKLTSYGALKLKQPHWGAWGDKQAPSTSPKIHFKIGNGDVRLLE